jgi:hypothetical protein
MFMVQTIIEMFSGFTSYVGKQVYVKRAKVFLDLEYYECESLTEIWPRHKPTCASTRYCFSPWMIHYLARINESQYDKLLLAKLHDSFDPRQEGKRKVKLCHNFISHLN